MSYDPFPMLPETGTKDARKCNNKHQKDTYPKRIILQRKKQNNFLKKVGDFLITIYKWNYKPVIILKDYVGREDLSSNERARIIKKLTKIKNNYQRNLIYMESCKFPFFYPLSLRNSYAYVIAYCEQQLRLLQLLEENLDIPPITQEYACKEVFI